MLVLKNRYASSNSVTHNLSHTCRKIKISQLVVLTRRQGKLCEKMVHVYIHLYPDTCILKLTTFGFVLAISQEGLTRDIPIEFYQIWLRGLESNVFWRNCWQFSFGYQGNQSYPWIWFVWAIFEDGRTRNIYQIRLSGF